MSAMTGNHREQVHKRLMKAVCRVILDDNKPLVLKGGTALLLCYGLDRFSEDLDFDIECSLRGHINIESVCRQAVKLANKDGSQIRLEAFFKQKKTETTHRCRPSFSMPGESTPFSIKIEISSRQLPVQHEIAIINGVKVYRANAIARQKLLAATEDPRRNYRTAARDLHDLAFLASKFEADLSADVLADLESFFADQEALLMRYADAYDMDPILSGRIFADLSVIEAWVHDRDEPEGPTLFGPG